MPDEVAEVDDKSRVRLEVGGQQNRHEWSDESQGEGFHGGQHHHHRTGEVEPMSGRRSQEGYCPPEEQDHDVKLLQPFFSTDGALCIFTIKLAFPCALLV